MVQRAIALMLTSIILDDASWTQSPDANNRATRSIDDCGRSDQYSARLNRCRARSTRLSLDWNQLSLRLRLCDRSSVCRHRHNMPTWQLGVLGIFDIAIADCLAAVKSRMSHFPVALFQWEFIYNTIIYNTESS